MIRVRVDDFPQTKGEPQHTLVAFREFHRVLTEGINGKRYLLGVIPGRVSVEDLLMLRNETDVIVGMHGTDHDEARLDRNGGNQFENWWTQEGIENVLREQREALAVAVGRPVLIYMPPRNVLDLKTSKAALNVGFNWFTTGPETQDRFYHAAHAIHSQPPHEYGRSDELLARGSHKVLYEECLAGRDVVLTLHWTWETNIGLRDLKLFLSQIPPQCFVDFDA